MNGLVALVSLTLALFCQASGQVIEFESNGLKYQTLTRSGVTIIFAHLPSTVSEYSIIQVSVANGSGAPYTVRPEDFSFVRGDGSTIRGVPAKDVVAELY